MRAEQKKRYEKWKLDYNGWKESGKSQKSYCDENEIPYNLFSGRITQLQKQGYLPKRLSVRNPPMFTELIATTEFEGVERVPYCEIKMADGSQIIIKTVQNIERLKNLLTMGLK